MRRAAIARALGLTDSNLALINDAIRDAERNTSGEIAIAITRESSDYSFRELFVSVLLGAAAFAALLPFHSAVARSVDRAFWHHPDWYVSAFYGIVLLATTGIAFAFANVPAIDRLIVPRRERSRAVFARAMRHFAESGVYATREGTGILVFVSLLEREVRIVADSGISGKIPQAEWDDIARSLARGIKERRSAQAIVETVTRCGSLLASHFPPRGDNPNELQDGIVFLEAGQ